jgi:tRNA G18 (ribose-2'-O)-methylase SpoU
VSGGTAVARSSDELITGRRAVAEAIGTGRAIEVLVTPGARRNQGLRAVLGAADRARVPVREVGRADLDQLAGAAPGGGARPPPPPTWSPTGSAPAGMCLRSHTS